MRGILTVGVRWAASSVTALATVFLVGWSGGLAALVTSPGDNSRAGWLGAAAVCAGLALFPAVACVAATRPARFALRLFLMSVVTWLTLAAGSALGGFVATVVFPLIGVMGVVTLGVLAQTIHADTGDVPPPTGA